MNESARDASEGAVIKQLRKENAALRQQKAKLEQLVGDHNELLSLTSFALNRVREAAYLLDSAGHLVYVNNEASRSLGYDRKELSQMCVWDIDPDWTPARWSEAWARLRTDGSATIETTHRRRDGSLVPVEINASHFEYGGQEYNLALARDVTEREQAKVALRESEIRHRQVFDNVSELLFLLDVTPEGRLQILEVNPACERSLGVSRESLIGETVDEVLPKDIAAVINERLALCIQSRTTREDTLSFELPSGRRHYHSTLIPVLDEADKIRRVVGIARDVTDLAMTERALRESEQAFRALAENAPDAIVRYAPDFRRTYVNPEFVRVTGVEAEKLLGQPSDVLGATDEVAERVQEELGAIMKSGVAARFEVNWVRRGLPQCWYAHAVPEYDSDGVIRSVLTIWRDITERKDAEQRLQESYELLRELTSRRETAREEERRRIAREMHDELGQNLTALRMNVSTLGIRFAESNPGLGTDVQRILTLSDRAMRVLRDVVTSLRPAALDAGINAALEWLVADFSKNSKTSCHLSVPEDSVELAEERAIALFRIVQEALTNIARHANANKVFIELQQLEGDCFLELCDDGCGFDPNSIPKRSFGLAGMKERILMLGGALDVLSSPGEGTTIKVRLPYG
ncbi:PAS domain S-box protein [Paraburkholderia sp. EG285A]|uniref:PAS domain S-box protein n=1 Tax=Paraburkholderia sp. EG285A TaxID=3237009 RepID=UPI0034D329EB